jgi:hypothetical protein
VSECGWAGHMRKHVPLVECTRLNSAHSRTLSRCNVDVLAQEWMVGYPQVLRAVAACKCLQQLMSVCVRVWKENGLPDKCSQSVREDRPRVRDDISTLSCYHTRKCMLAQRRGHACARDKHVQLSRERAAGHQHSRLACQALGTRNCEAANCA